MAADLMALQFRALHPAASRSDAALPGRDYGAAQQGDPGHAAAEHPAPATMRDRGADLPQTDGGIADDPVDATLRRVVIITPVFNAVATIAETIRSVINQTYPEWRLIIVDDGSTDDTFAVVAGCTDPRVRLVRQDNRGVSAARNTGLQLIDEDDAVLFLDGDDWLAPHALAELIAALDDCPWAIAAVGRYARVGRDGQAHGSAQPADGDILTRVVTRNLFANGGHLLITADAIRATAWFRTDLRYGEDWEYWSRLALQGEFAATRGREPILFVRERADGTCYARATDAALYALALDAIHANAGIVERLGVQRLRALRNRGDAEIAWAVGRELIRHGRITQGQAQLCHSLRIAPTFKRICMVALSWSGMGPFRPYHV